MTCDFSLAHYDHTLRAALARGCRFVAFGEAEDRHPRIYLRHDVDFSLVHARRMAGLEAALGIRSSYFVQCNTPFYNLFEEDTREAIQQVHAAGHAIGLHLDERCADEGEDLRVFAERVYAVASRLIPLARLVSFHRPTAAVLGRTVPGFISTNEPGYMRPGRYISDSRKHWRTGCLCARLPEPSDSVQALVHPEWWNNADTDSAVIGQDILADRLEHLQHYMRANCQPFREVRLEARVPVTI